MPKAKPPYNIFITNRKNGDVSLCEYVRAKKRLVLLIKPDDPTTATLNSLITIIQWAQKQGRTVALRGDKNEEIAKLLAQAISNTSE